MTELLLFCIVLAMAIGIYVFVQAMTELFERLIVLTKVLYWLGGHLYVLTTNEASRLQLAHDMRVHETDPSVPTKLPDANLE